jgi:hypothetical protein
VIHERSRQVSNTAFFQNLVVLEGVFDYWECSWNPRARVGAGGRLFGSLAGLHGGLETATDNA